jgi:hypothetical protein
MYQRATHERRPRRAHHRDKYGRSDKLNAPENQNREFKDGYRVSAKSMSCNSGQILEKERILRRKIGEDTGVGFEGYKRARSGQLAQNASSWS